METALGLLALTVGIGYAAVRMMEAKREDRMVRPAEPRIRAQRSATRPSIPRGYMRSRHSEVNHHTHIR